MSDVGSLTRSMGFGPSFGPFVLMLVLAAPAAQAESGTGCIPVVDKIAHLAEPGTYCLRRNLSTRFDLPDRRAEIALIMVEASNVVLDLQGHAVGDMTPLFPSDISGGIRILASVRNFEIRNGTIRNLKTCIKREWEHSPGEIVRLQPDRRDELNFDFSAYGIRARNVRLQNCRNDIVFEIARPVSQ